MDEAELRETLDASPLVRLVSLAGHSVGQQFSRVVGRHRGLSPGGAGVLTVLGWGAGRGIETGVPGRATHADLAKRCLIAPATLTGIVKTLERSGLVRRERDDDDRRLVWLVITDKGLTEVRSMGRQMAAATEPLLRGLDPEQEQIIRNFLTGVIIANHEKE
jgi:DNA-binding MarR family transcriptional regulator